MHIKIIVNNNKEEILSLLKDNNYKRIGHYKKDLIAYFIDVTNKKFFEISTLRNPKIEEISDLEKLKNIL